MSPVADLLTIKQLQDLLQVDRTTIYRMLKDGRLHGIKVGGRWRFERSAIEAWLRRTSDPLTARARAQAGGSGDVLPLHCIQIIQDVFAEIAGIGSVTTGMDGEPLTEVSNVQPVCRKILGSEKGLRACVASWRALAESQGGPGTFERCHAGLEYSGSRIQVHHHNTQMLVAGQFYSQPPSKNEERARLAAVEARLELEPGSLQDIADTIPVLEPRMRNRFGHWLSRVAQSFCQIGEERLELIGRLRQIAEMTSLG
jgi:excisionase family DNA binding protein